jgi:molybdopterin-guanine dinucleotide biosynthesis protein A
LREMEATGVVLAGGRSRRMGRDKLPLKIGGATLLDRVHEVLSSRCTEVLVVGEGGAALAGAHRIPDLRPGEGPLAGIETGLLAASHRRVFVAAGDMPFLNGEIVGGLLDLLSGSTQAVVPDIGLGIHPLCAAYAREVRPEVSAALDGGVRSVREFLRGMPDVMYVGESELRRFGDPNLLLTNVNSPEDLLQARAALDKGVARG